MSSKNVYDNPLIPKRLLNSDYYKDQLTLLLKGSFGVPEQIDLFTDILNVHHTRALDLFSLLGVYDKDKEKWRINIEKINKIDKEGKESDLLDKLAEIVGCSRYYSFLDTPLNNSDLYKLICFRIAKNNFLGTYSELSDIYNDIFGEGFIDYYTSKDENATCTIVLIKDNIADDSGEILDDYKNLYQLFTHDYLEIKSMGIKYNKIESFSNRFGFFDKYPSKIDEDTGEIIYDEDSQYCKFDSAYFY